jgi:hypothetical protein
MKMMREAASDRVRKIRDEGHIRKSLTADVARLDASLRFAAFLPVCGVRRL